MKSDVPKMLERQAAWQRQRAALPWADKLRRAVAMRGLRPRPAPQPRPRGRPMTPRTARARLRGGQFTDAVLRACEIHVWCNADGELGDRDRRWGWRVDKAGQLGFQTREAACQAAAAYILAEAGDELATDTISIRLGGPYRELARRAGRSINDGVRGALHRDAAVRKILASKAPTAEKLAELRGLYGAPHEAGQAAMAAR